jgi:hypothetical protein
MRLASAAMLPMPKRLDASLAVTFSPFFNAVNNLWVFVPLLIE